MSEDTNKRKLEKTALEIQAEEKMVGLEKEIKWQDAAIKKQDEKLADNSEAIRSCINLIDPKGVGHVPNGSAGVYQEVLEALMAAVEG
jgi:hypothetical protein